MTCPKCKKEVQIVRYGFGYVGHCCGEILYNAKEKPIDWWVRPLHDKKYYKKYYSEEVTP